MMIHYIGFSLLSLFAIFVIYVEYKVNEKKRKDGY